MPDAKQQALRALVVRRRQLLQLRVAEENHLNTGVATPKKSIRAMLGAISTQLRHIDEDIANTSSCFVALAQQLRAVDGMGPKTTATLIVEYPSWEGSRAAKSAHWRGSLQ